MADKHNTSKGKITQKYNISRANTCDPALKRFNVEITSDTKT